MSGLVEQHISQLVEARRAELIALTQDLVRTPSLSGDEAACAELVSSRMERLSYDKVTIDEVGNSIGTIQGSGHHRPLLFNGHIDHVPPGDMQDPYSAIIAEGDLFGVSGQVIFGRAASDMKGALACMIMAGSIIKSLGVRLNRPMQVSAVVLEETQGLGSRQLAEADLKPAAVIIGESTNLDVALGHRGSIGVSITTYGRSCHASVPEQGVNALYKMLPILERIQNAAQDLPSHPVLGRSSMAVTTISVNPNIKNVIPSSCTAGLDVRNIPDYSPNQVLQTIRALAEEERTRDPQINVMVSFGRGNIRSYTGVKKELDLITPSFYTEKNTALAQIAREAATKFVGKDVQFKVWKFATDGCYFAEKGIPTIGFGPGEERFAHSAEDNIRIEDLVTATKVYTLLAIKYCT